jgi:hypothetical protein
MLNLSEVYSDYLDSLKEDKDRDPHRLFLSDVGKCPRQVGYRLLETEKNPVNDQTRWNKTIMFANALYMEDVMAKALSRKGVLVAYQEDVDVYDRVNWGGRLDIVADLDGVRVVEFKTLNPNAFRHGLDYPHYRGQAMSYDVYCKEVYDLTAAPFLAYFDRAGQNTFQVEIVETDEHYVRTTMDTLEKVRNEAIANTVTYPKLDKVLVMRSYDKQLVYEPQWGCQWCDYSDVCKPDMSKSVWATRDDNRSPWTIKRAADPAILEAYATKTLERFV